jgi:predicted O-methyltransferase YrrM
MLAEVYNRILKEKPRVILEIGSGLSTVVASYAAQKNGFGQVVSWDVVEPRASRVRELLDLHDQTSRAKVVNLSPFDKQDTSDEILWNDGHPPEKIDFLIVDATSDSSKNPEHMKAVETVKPMLAIGCTIFIHDSFEARDREAVAEWMSEIRELSLVHTKQASTHKYSFLRFGNGFLFKE